MFWIIGGTGEAAEVERQILDMDNYVITIATEEGKEFLRGSRFFVGRMDMEEMKIFCRKWEIKSILDLSHPYAQIVSENAKTVAKELKIDYYRYVRPKAISGDKEIFVEDVEGVCQYIRSLSGTFLFSTGSKNAPEFLRVRGENRFIFRVLPSEDSIRILREHGVEMKDIIAELGPFSEEQNYLTMKEKAVDYLITKDSGSVGGADEKIRAARRLGVQSIVIGRREESGIDLGEAVRMIRGSNTQKGRI